MASRVRKAPIVGAGLVIVLTVFLAFRSRIPEFSSSVPSAEPAASVAPAPVSGPASVRLCGSNTIGVELAPALVEDYLSSKGATDVRRESSSSVVVVSGSLAGERFIVEVRSAGTGTAFKEMAAGRCDVAMASRDATADELQTVKP